MTDLPIEVDVESMKQKYKAIKANFLAKDHILAIEECGSAIFTLPDEDKLKRLGIKGRPLQFRSETFDQSAPPDEEIAGRHIGVEIDDGRLSVILMKSDYSADPAYVCALKICVLYHELGHANDFYEEINFRHSTMNCDTEASEKYADRFAKKRLKRIRCQPDQPPTLWDFYEKLMYVGKYSS